MVTTLTLIDGRHEELVAALPPLSPKLAAVRLLAHLRDLLPLQEAPQTLFYHVDTARRLCALILEPSPISGHPGFLRELVGALSSYSTGPAANRTQTLQSARDRLRLLLGAELAIRGDWPEVSALLPDMASSIKTQPDIAAFLAALAERLEASGPAWPFHLRDPATSVGKGSILTVLVDSPAVPEAYREAYLTLLTAKVTVHKRRGEEPHAVRSRDDTGEDLPLGDDLKDLVREAIGHALRLLGPNISRRSERHRFEIEIALRRPDPVTTVQGRSILLPLVLVLAEQLSEQLNLPFALRPNRSLVWTGDIDQHGTLATVGDIGLKASRVAASRVDGLAIPAFDLPAATSTTRGAARGPLGLHGLTTLADVITQEELALLPGRSLPVRAGALARRKARPLGIAGVGVVAALLVALAVVIWNLASWLDTVATSARLVESGARAEILNSRGRVLHRLRCPIPVTTPPSLGDVDDDGIPEVFLGTAPNDSLAGTLFCIDVNGRERWRFFGGFPDTSSRPYALRNTFGAAGSYVHDLNRDGHPEVIAAFKHRSSYAGHLAVLGADGKLIGSFWNPGHIISEPSRSGYEGVLFADIDGDGLDEVIASATNNSCRRAALIVLDPRSLSGKGFSCSDSTIVPSWQTYVLFPEFREIVAAMGSRRFEVAGLTIEKGTGRRILKLGLRCIIPDLGHVMAIHYLLSFDFEVLDTYFGDQFVAWSERARTAGLLDLRLGSMEFQAEVRRLEIHQGAAALLMP